MAYFSDLSHCSYFGPTETKLWAVGWLDRAHPFSKGEVPRDRFLALARLLASPWQPAVAAGRHRCELCTHTGGPTSMRIDDVDVNTIGNSNLFVPTEEGVFVAPSTILHYIDAHGYAPPEEFLVAVENCPPMRSMPYLQAIARHHLTRLGWP